MLTVNAAQETILEQITPLAPQSLRVAEACGLFLAESLTATLDLPPFRNSQMDGYAVQSVDLASASEASPIRLPVQFETAAGSPAGRLSPRKCARVMTGAAMPDGADAVVPREQVKEYADAAVFTDTAEIGQSVRMQGEDVRVGERLLEAGTRLGPFQIALLAAEGITDVPVHPKPRLVILSTGDELVQLGNPLGPGQVYDSNGPTLFALANAFGAKPAFVTGLSDDLDQTVKALRAISERCDAIVTVGAVSKGEKDYIRPAVEQCGEVIFHRVAMRPGQPTLFGRVGEVPLFGLPGNPVSAVVTFLLFVIPALRRMMGRPDLFLPEVEAECATPFPASGSRESYWRGVLSPPSGPLPYPEGEYSVCSAGAQGSHILKSLAASNCLVRTMPGETLREGDVAQCLICDFGF
jgi:molybdopterin molybdotransferase